LILPPRVVTLQEVLLEQKWNAERIALNQGSDLNIINRD